jgi:hypothetical protein
MRAGRARAQAIPRAGVTGGGDHWASHGEDLFAEVNEPGPRSVQLRPHNT